MKKILILCMLCVFTTAFVSCSENKDISSDSTVLENSVAENETSEIKSDSQKETVAPVEVVEDGMSAVYGSEIKDGVYS
ncbi:MAG: hypothetical protein K2K14_06770, partial [Ruminococcus sp.]|nr:hypothetical protein [Ruminococcus sp.]